MFSNPKKQQELTERIERLEAELAELKAQAADLSRAAESAEAATARQIDGAVDQVKRAGLTLEQRLEGRLSSMRDALDALGQRIQRLEDRS